MGAVLHVDALCCVGVVLITYSTDAGRAHVVTWSLVVGEQQFWGCCRWGVVNI